MNDGGRGGEVNEKVLERPKEKITNFSVDAKWPDNCGSQQTRYLYTEN